jgi:hypothetical protein
MKPLPGQCWQSSRFISRASSLTPSATAWIGGLFANHDAANASVRIPLLGATIQLGENESGENEHGESRPREHEDDDDDD